MFIAGAKRQAQHAPQASAAVQVTTNTGRKFVGTFTCLDHLGNLLLFDAVENVALKTSTFERPLQQAVVPLKLIQKAEVLVRAPACMP